MKSISPQDKTLGAMLAFAVGDAYGYPVRGMTYAQMCQRFDKKGCLDLAVSRKTNTALFTDATQLMLFTADGILWADAEAGGGAINYTAYVFYAYQLWLYTQTKAPAGPEYNWLFAENKNHNPRLLRAKGLYRPRTLDDKMVSILSAARDMNYGRISKPVSNYSDADGLKRVLPAGIYFNYDTETAFRAGADFAAITHGHPDAYLAAGCYSAAIADIINGEAIDDAFRHAMRILRQYDGHENVFAALDQALNLLEDRKISPMEAMRRLGTGYEAPQALAMAFFAAVLHKDSFVLTLQLAANQDGASDTVTALAAGLLGALYGTSCIPARWLKKLQYEEMIEKLADHLAQVTVFGIGAQDE
jgi:ADP-ribosylglycohydrolase